MNTQIDKRELRLLERGSNEAIERWFYAHSEALYTFIFYRTGKDQRKALEVVQETLFTALRQLNQFEPEKESMFAWLCRLSKESFEKSGQPGGPDVSFKIARVKTDPTLSNACKKIATEPFPVELIERQETTELIQIALTNIPAEYKQVLKEYYYELKPIKEIAESLGIDSGNVRAMLHRARNAFKEVFVQLCCSSKDAEAEGGRQDG
jgi:RNA polymerase sigma-70 factor (ECF subfamily)